MSWEGLGRSEPRNVPCIFFLLFLRTHPSHTASDFWVVSTEIGKDCRADDMCHSRSGANNEITVVETQAQKAVTSYIYRKQDLPSSQDVGRVPW